MNLKLNIYYLYTYKIQFNIMTDEYTNTTYQNLTFEQHVRLRINSYLGPKQPTLNETWIINQETKKLSKESLTYSIAQFGCIDELILNYIDHCYRTINIKGKGKCTTLKVDFDKNTGSISIENNGEGIVVEKVENEDYYIPEMVFSKSLSGSNFNDDDGQISCGMNGIGCKAVSVCSSRFEIETNDLKNKLNYIQVFENGNTIKNRPVITKAKIKDPYTKITLMLDYEYFDDKGFTEELSIILEKLIYTRLSFVSSFMGPKYKIYYNDELININSLYDLSKMLIDEDELIKCTMYKKENKLDKPIDIVIGLYDCNNSQEQISFVNGIFTVEGGSHIQYINKCILEKLKPKLEKKLKDKIKVTNKIISSHLFIFCSMNILNPEYTNQYKSKLKVPESRFKDYILDDKIYVQIWKMLESKIDEIYNNKISEVKVTRKMNDLKGIKKYRSANYAGTAKSSKCTVFAVEGDSAEKLLRDGLTSRKDLGYDYYGIYNLTGVIMNARKEVDIKEIKRNGVTEYVIDKKKKLMDNERISSFVKVLNLNYSYTYESDVEFKTLRYGKVVIAVDFDLDGIGFIGPLLLSYFELFFPKLLERKYVGIFYTPCMRAYPIKKQKNKFIEEFYNIDEYNKWCETNNSNDYKVKWIKGLATHTKAETVNLFRNMKSKIYTYELDNKAKEYFDIFFGDVPDKRKMILSNENTYFEDDYEEKFNNKLITCSYQLNTSTREFQLDNIQRKLPHIIDGLNEAKRKVLFASIDKFRKNNEEIKVFQLGGHISNVGHYHHGPESLNKTICGFAQEFIGGKHVPLLLPIGNFGSRYNNKPGAARYISTKLCKEVVELLFPYIDNDLLEYRISDGVQVEPKNYCPILPYAIMESNILPSTGWRASIYARDYDQIISNVKKLIKNENAKLSHMKYFKNKFKGSEVLTKDFNILIGTYNIINENEVQILELPPMCWTGVYLESLDKYDFIDKVFDESSTDDVSIKVIFKKGELKRLRENYKQTNEYIDYIHDALKLYTKLSHHINLYTQKNTVAEFDNYTDIIKIWFKERKDCYIRRVERERILLLYKILILENTIKFIENHKSYHLSKNTNEVIDKILLENGYIKINKSIIDSPGLTKNEELEGLILNEKASFGYLLNLSYMKMNKDSYDRNVEKLKDLRQKLEFYQKDNVYKEIWLNEINELTKVLKEGFKHGFYKEDDSLFRKE